MLQYICTFKAYVYHYLPIYIFATIYNHMIIFVIPYLFFYFSFPNKKGQGQKK